MPGNRKVFISHTHADNERCAPMLAALDAWGVDYWFDTQQLGAGQQLSERLQQAIADRDIFVRVLTAATPQSFWMSQELSAFRGLQAVDAQRGRSDRRQVIQLILTPDAPREPLVQGDLLVDTVNQPQIAWLRQLRQALGVTPPRRPLSRRAALSLGALTAIGVVAVSAGGTLLLAEGRGSPPAPLPAPKTRAPTPTAVESAQRLKWFFRAGYSLGLTIAATSGIIFVLSGDGLYALSATDGSVLWFEKNVQGDYERGLLVDGDTLYVGGEDNSLAAIVVALSTHDGTQRWKVTLDNDPDGAPTLADGLLYVAAQGTILAFSASDGTRLWSTVVANDRTNSSPVVANGRIYIGAADKNLHVLDAATGSPLWRYATGGPIGATPAVADGVVYFTSEDGYLYALDLNTQSPRWPHIKLGFLVDASPLVQNGVVYVGSTNGFLIAFDALTGAVRWQAPAGMASADNSSVTNNANVKTRPVISGDTIYITASDDSYATFVYAFRVSDGSRLWRFGTLPATISDYESAPFVADGQIYFSGNDQAVYALSI